MGRDDAARRMQEALIGLKDKTRRDRRVALDKLLKVQ